MRIVRGFLSSCLLLMGLASVTACDPATGIMLDTENGNVRMMDSSYQAADALIKQAGPMLDPSTPLLIGTLSDVSKMETSSPLGRMVAEQVGARFVQRGFIVSDVRFRNAINVKDSAKDPSAAGEYFLSRDTAVLKGEQDVGAIITGTYVVARNEVLVNLRLMEASSSRVLAAHDYRMPMTRDVRSLVDNSTSKEAFKPGLYSLDWNW